MSAAKRHLEQMERLGHLEYMIEQIIEFAEHNASFDPSFIYSVREKFERFGDLTEKQEKAVYNIYERFDVSNFLEMRGRS